MGRVGRYHGDMWTIKDKGQFTKRRIMGRKRKASVLHEHWSPYFRQSTRGVKKIAWMGQPGRTIEIGGTGVVSPIPWPPG